MSKYWGLLLLIQIMVIDDSISQVHSKIWTFGSGAGIDFNVVPPVGLTTGLLFSAESGTTVTDGSGALLFFASGDIIYNRRYQPMKNGTGLLGNGGSSAQAPLILQNPADSNQYYVFETADEVFPQYKGQLYYSIVDLCGDNGFGEVLQNKKNIQIQGSFSERITAIALKNGQAFWILCSKLFENTIYTYYFDNNGINPVPVTSFFGNEYSAEVGFIVANHKKNQFLYSSSLDKSNNGVWLMNFDTLTGKASNRIQITINQHTYGVAFSPNDKFIYYSYFFTRSGIVQYDPAKNKYTTLADYAGNYLYGSMAEGLDKIIYIAKTFKNKLAAILNPDLGGAACNYNENYFQLAPNTSCYLTLQNSEFNFKTKKYITVPTNLLGNDTTLCEPFKLKLTVNKANISWSDGSANPDLIVDKAGIYWVSYYNCDSIFTDTLKIQKIIDTASNFISICPGDSVLISGNWYKDSMQITRMINNSNGCDSLITTQINLYPKPVSSNFKIGICQGDSVQVNGIWYSDSSLITQIKTNIHGCDSLITTQIIVSPKSKPTTIIFGICPGDSIQVQGNWYKDSTQIVQIKMNANGCDSIITTQINVYSKPKQTQSIFELCVGDSMLIEGTWYKDSVRILNKLQDSNGCDFIHQIELRLNPLLHANDLHLFICKGDSVKIDNQWIFNEASGTAHKKNSNQCDSIYHYMVEMYPPIILELTPDLQINQCEQIQLFPMTSSNVSSFTWKPSSGLSCTNCSNPIANPLSNIRYYLEVKDNNGCSVSDSIMIRVRAIEEKIFFPNVFTPNGDNINDLWFPVLSSKNGAILSLSVFDRWGNLVHDCHTSLNCLSWDGNAHDTKCVPGVYVYIVEWRDCAGEVKKEKGDLMLIR